LITAKRTAYDSYRTWYGNIDEIIRLYKNGFDRGHEPYRDVHKLTCGVAPIVERIAEMVGRSRVRAEKAGFISVMMDNYISAPVRIMESSFNSDNISVPWCPSRSVRKKCENCPYGIAMSHLIRTPCGVWMGRYITNRTRGGFYVAHYGSEVTINGRAIRPPAGPTWSIENNYMSFLCVIDLVIGRYIQSPFILPYGISLKSLLSAYDKVNPEDLKIRVPLTLILITLEKAGIEDPRMAKYFRPLAGHRRYTSDIRPDYHTKPFATFEIKNGKCSKVTPIVYEIDFLNTTTPLIPNVKNVYYFR